MGVLNIYHPDIFEYLNAKSYDEGKLIHFNLSIMIDDNFMKAKEKGEDIWLHYPVYDEKSHIITDESKWITKKKVNSLELWNLIMQKAYDTGEYGVFFYDNLNKDNNTYYLETIVSSNPCGEYVSGTLHGETPLTHEIINPDNYMGACNLGSVFFQNFIKNPFTKDAKLDYTLLEDIVYKAVRTLDDIIDINKFPDIAYENYQKNMRTIGLGFTGLGDTLVMLNLIYGEKKALSFTNDLLNIYAKFAYRASIDLAKEKGSFPFLDKKKFVQSGFIQKHIKFDKEWEIIAEDILKYGIRNARILSVAPTGTLSLTFGSNCSSGLEPIFALEYDRKVKIGGQSDDDIKIVKMEDYAYKLWKETTKDNIVKKEVFVTAMNLPVEAHVSMLSIIAFHTDMSCSKTINIPTEYPFEKTKDVYNECWKNGIKGCTIFRPNALRQGIMITDKKEDKNIETKIEDTVSSITRSNELPRGTIMDVDDSLIGKKQKLQTGCGSLHVEAFFSPDTGDMMEVYLSKGSSGGCNSFMVGLSRMISISLRGGIPLESLVDQLGSVLSCPSYATRNATKHDTSKGKCCPDAIGRSLMIMQKEMWEDIGVSEYTTTEHIDYYVDLPKKQSILIKDVEVIESSSNSDLSKEDKEYIKENGEAAFATRYHRCPICGNELQSEGGCVSCNSCGFSRCE